jgi:predicted DNA-binding ribbon-helix-helix protein
MTSHATAADFATWETKAKSMTVAALLWSIRDASECAQNFESFDPIAASRYADEASTYGQELARRRAA